MMREIFVILFLIFVGIFGQPTIDTTTNVDLTSPFPTVITTSTTWQFYPTKSDITTSESSTETSTSESTTTSSTTTIPSNICDGQSNS